MADHKRHHPPATPASFRTFIPKIHHNACGGRLWHSSWRERWTCDGCLHEWKDETVEKFTEAECELRFHLRGDIDQTAHAIVWVQDPLSKKYHTKLVPVSEAGNYPERFKL